MSWGGEVWQGFWTVLVGMDVTWKHLFARKSTQQYPEERWSVAPKSRMRLFMKYEDCIGCGQCARACPVQCIYIKTEKRPATAPPIWAANGQAIKLDTTVFDIDMSLCCYCNLCTYPCPTNCLYMTPEYEFATGDLSNHLYRFAKKPEDASFLLENPKPKPAAAPAPASPTKPAAPSPPGAQGTPGTSET
jgi:NADH-quinone oxidoreductase subunit I